MVKEEVRFGFFILEIFFQLFFLFQISADDAVLPGADGKVVAWVEEDQLQTSIF